jgi:hypothetical protein
MKIFFESTENTLNAKRIKSVRFDIELKINFFIMRCLPPKPLFHCFSRVEHFLLFTQHRILKIARVYFVIYIWIRFFILWFKQAFEVLFEAVLGRLKWNVMKWRWNFWLEIFCEHSWIWIVKWFAMIGWDF